MIAVYADPATMIEQGAPRIIRSEAELARYSQTLFQLTAKDEPSEAEVEAIDLLSLLIERYEAERYPLPKASSVEVLRFLMDQHGLQQRDLGEVLGCSAPTVRIAPAMDAGLAHHVWTLEELVGLLDRNQAVAA